jgi:hypothetical protein
MKFHKVKILGEVPFVLKTDHRYLFLFLCIQKTSGVSMNPSRHHNIVLLY